MVPNGFKNLTRHNAAEPPGPRTAHFSDDDCKDDTNPRLGAIIAIVMAIVTYGGIALIAGWLP
jgi:hypothetical protein